MTIHRTKANLPRFRVATVIVSEIKLLQKLRTVSRYSISFGIALSLAWFPFGGMPMQFQLLLALIALVIGIPHGAVDHLITVPKFASLKMALFLTAYLGVVGLAIWAIMSSNLLGFQIVVLMSALHFGLGDAAFVSELDRRQGKTFGSEKIVYLVASGFTPVLVPLVSDGSASALEAVNPVLVNWAGATTEFLLFAMVGFTLLAIFWMLAKRRRQEALDLTLLLTISLVAPPLVAFGFYFGLWHALRHTGRVSLELETARNGHAAGKPGTAFLRAVLAGVPALFIVVAFTLVLGWTTGFALPTDFIWYLLVVIWALTVPHMALTLRLDLKALRGLTAS